MTHETASDRYRYEALAKHSLGQNFLVDGGILETIASYVPMDTERVIEIGPGYGALTEYILARYPRHLTLVEKDTRMVEILRERLANDLVREGSEVAVIHGDVLTYSPMSSVIPPQVGIPPDTYWPAGDPRFHGDDDTGGVPYTLIGNIPYYITSPILRHFLFDVARAPETMTLLVQSEVADKVSEHDGKHSYLSLLVASRCMSIERVLSVPRTAFRPSPRVDSALLYMVIDPIRTVDPWVLRVLSVAFSHPRKRLASNLALGLGIDKARVTKILTGLWYSENVRAEEVGWEGYVRMGEGLILMCFV